MHEIVLFYRRSLFDPDFVLQCGGINIALKSDSETTRCDKLGIASLSVSNTFATLSVARGFTYAGASKKNAGRMLVCGGNTSPLAYSKVCDSFLIATGGAASSFGNLATAIAYGAATGGEIWFTMFGGSDGTGGVTLSTIYISLIESGVVPALSTLTATAGNQTDAHSTELYSFIAYGNTGSTTPMNQIDQYSPYSNTNSSAYILNQLTNAASARAIGGNESRMIVVGGQDENSHWFSTMEEVSVLSRTGVRSWGTLGTAKSDMGMAGSQFRQIITNGRSALVTATTGRDYFNMESHTLNATYDNTGGSFWGYGVDSGSN